MTATLTVGVATPGLTQQGVAGTYTEATCLSTCKASTTCLVVDFNTSNQLCYFGTTANPATTSNSVVDHYTITRTNCAGEFLVVIKPLYFRIGLVLSELNVYTFHEAL